MHFDIRAIALVPSIEEDARIDLSKLLGSEIKFRSHITYPIRLPAIANQYANFAEADKVFTALQGWARLYRYPEAACENIHVIAPVEAHDGELSFYRLDFRQSPAPRGRERPPVEILSGASMKYQECADWLIELAYRWEVIPDQRQRWLILSRPCAVQLRRIRIAWVGPEYLDQVQAAKRLGAIGKVYRTDIVPIQPRRYADVAARLSGALPLHSAIICRRFAPYITDDAVPMQIPRNLIHFCDSADFRGLEQQVKTWIEVCFEQVESDLKGKVPDLETFILATMLRGMLSHSKIGQFNHCQKETVLKRVRARHLNAAAAEAILADNSEAYREGKEQQPLFLWKDHHDGRQYFLNPKRVEDIKILTLAGDG